MNKEKLLKAITVHHVTERSMRLQEDGIFVFKVRKDATKKIVAQAISLIYGVDVVSVRTCLYKPVAKRNPKTGAKGYTKAFKKAFIKLKEGQSIDFNTSINERGAA